MKEQILASLPDELSRQCNLLYFSSVESTNTYLRTLAKDGAPHGTVVIADAQTAGRGRMGRTFHSPAGKGLYMSILLRPNCAPGDLMHLTCATAVAACNAIENAVGIRPGIKWTNDLVFKQYKLAGILTELSIGKNAALEYAVVGIGINCTHSREDFPPELREIATSLAAITGRPIDRVALAAALIKSLLEMSKALLAHKSEILSAYRRDCITLGKNVSIVRSGESLHATALDIDSNGALIVSYADGTVEAVNSGEVSVRGMYGYV